MTTSRLRSALRFLVLFLFTITAQPAAAAQHRLPPLPSRQTSGATPFDATAMRLPPDYVGMDLRGLLAALEKWVSRLARDEFETTAQYKERLVTEKGKPVYGSVRVDSLLATVLSSRQKVL